MLSIICVIFLKLILTVTSQSTHPRTCLEYFNHGATEDKIYKIYYDGKTPIDVLCDMSNGGWTVIAKRNYDDYGHYVFNQPWSKYKNGFGHLNNSYWIGLEKMHIMTRRTKFHLRIDLAKGISIGDKFIVSDDFAVGPEDDYYKLTLGKKIYGTLYDSLIHHNNWYFSTFDKDHDSYSGNCAQATFGGWWFFACSHSCLTCENPDWGGNWGPDSSGINIIKYAIFEMKIRPVYSLNDL